MALKKHGFFLLLFFLLTSLNPQVQAAENQSDVSGRYLYLFFWEKSGLTVSIDTKSIELVTDNESKETYLSVWYKVELNEAARNRNLENRREANLSTDGWENFYRMDHFKIKPSQRQMCITQIMVLDSSSRNVLERKSFKPKWFDISPEGYSEEQYYRTLEYAKKIGLL